MMLSPFTLTSRSPVGWEETQSPPTLQQVLGGDTWLSPHSRAGSRTLSHVTPMLLQASPHRGEDGKIGRECMKGTKTGPHLQGGGAGSGAAPPTPTLCHLSVPLTSAQPCLVRRAILLYILHKDGVHGLQAAPGGT